MSPNRFCSLCGKPISSSEQFYNNFQCLNCYLKDNPLFLLKEFYYLNVCLECGSFSKESKVRNWISISADNIMEIVKNAVEILFLEPFARKENLDFSIKIDYDNISPYAQNVEDIFLDVSGTHKKDSNLTHMQKIKVKIKYGHCDKCISLKQKPIKSIIQLRVRFNEQMYLVEEAFEKIRQHMNTVSEKEPLDYISNIEQVVNGIDISLSTNNQNSKIIRMLKPQYKFITKHSKKLIGRDTQRGKNIYRFKTLIKFLPIAREDIVIINNVQYKVFNIGKNKIYLIDTNGNKIVKSYPFFYKKKVKILDKK